MRKGIASVLIGLVGLLVITYFYTLTEETNAEQGEVQQRIALYTLSLPLRVFLFTMEALGSILGFVAYKERSAKLGLLGMGLCTLCLIMLYGYLS